MHSHAAESASRPAHTAFSSHQIYYVERNLILYKWDLCLKYAVESASTCPHRIDITSSTSRTKKFDAVQIGPMPNTFRSCILWQDTATEVGRMAGREMEAWTHARMYIVGQVHWKVIEMDFSTN